ncbi:phage head-tail adapter protein [Staphylococcus haemolyticus]|uniref:phage head-tail adapter protein n=1 Tax=Staphylococcus haemolyticus TaxID=1283 RepID=UPI000D1D854B|nr:phage head-tail adapter protein [Staphylococcus haemolyticus]PTK72372.1 phage head-tail adapter protein [Staphylococcus haemolyticus]
MVQSRRDFVTGGEMRTPVIFYKAIPSDDFLPGETVDEEVYKCFANVYPPSQKDLDMTDKEASITMVAWYPMDKEITDDMYFEIALPRYKDQKFNIVETFDDTDYHRNLKVIGKIKQ